MHIVPVPIFALACQDVDSTRPSESSLSCLVQHIWGGLLHGSDLKNQWNMRATSPQKHLKTEWWYPAERGNFHLQGCKVSSKDSTVGACQSNILMDGRSAPKAEHSLLRTGRSPQCFPVLRAALPLRKNSNSAEQATFCHCSAGASGGGQGSAWALCLVRGPTGSFVSMFSYCLLPKLLISGCWKSLSEEASVPVIHNKKETK